MTDESPWDLLGGKQDTMPCFLGRILYSKSLHCFPLSFSFSTSIRKRQKWQVQLMFDCQKHWKNSNQVSNDHWKDHLYLCKVVEQPEENTQKIPVSYWSHLQGHFESMSWLKAWDVTREIILGATLFVSYHRISFSESAKWAEGSSMCLVFSEVQYWENDWFLAVVFSFYLWVVTKLVQNQCFA